LRNALILSKSRGMQGVRLLIRPANTDPSLHCQWLQTPLALSTHENRTPVT